VVTLHRRDLKLLKESSASIEDVDFMFENTSVKIVANRNCPEIELAGFKVDPLEEGKEYEVRFWVAQELENAGIAHFREDEVLNAVKLYKIHWKECVQAARQISSLEEDFYPKLRRFLANLERAALNNPERMKEHEKVTRLFHDILNCRLRKIVSLASSPTQTDQTLKNMAREERMLYEHLHAVIDEWRSKISKLEDEP